MDSTKKDERLVIRINSRKKTQLTERLKGERIAISALIEELIDRYLSNSSPVELRVVQEKLDSLEEETKYLKHEVASLRKLAEEKLVA
jgi:bacterioferritin (cytochrome b1)